MYNFEINFYLLFSENFIYSLLGVPQTALKGPNVDGRIVGGRDTTIEDHPYIVSVQIHNTHGCGGSILSPIWILSAAHCFIESLSAYSIRTGSTTINSGGEVIAIRRIINHPDYNAPTADYDISLLELDSPITTIVARSVALAAEGGPPAAGVTATVTGWGALWEGGPLSTILQVIQVPIISMADCRAVYGANFVTDRMFCAGFLGVGGVDACQSDSGGPLIANGVLTGVVSWGFGCARPDGPGVYVSIPNLRQWIRDVTDI